MLTMSSTSASDAFCAVKGMCKVLGVISHEKNSFSFNLSIFINIISLALQFALCLPLLAYFLYSSDVNDAAEVLSILFPVVLHLGQYFILVLTKPQLAALFQEFEDLIQSSAFNFRLHFMITKKYISKKKFNFQELRST